MLDAVKELIPSAVHCAFLGLKIVLRKGEGGREGKRGRKGGRGGEEKTRHTMEALCV